MNQQDTKPSSEPRKEEEAPKKEKTAQQKDTPKGLTKEELPDATNESTGQMGSGQRQDSN
jgi:hypothetical protein